MRREKGRVKCPLYLTTYYVVHLSKRILAMRNCPRCRHPRQLRYRRPSIKAEERFWKEILALSNRRKLSPCDRKIPGNADKEQKKTHDVTCVLHKLSRALKSPKKLSGKFIHSNRNEKSLTKKSFILAYGGFRPFFLLRRGCGEIRP